MKKALFVLLILSLSIVLVACGTAKTELDMIREKVSYEEHCISIAENDDCRIEVMGVKGEIAPTIDGKVGESNGRYIVKFNAKKLDGLKDNSVVTLICGENKTTVTLQKDVLGMSYTANVSEDVIKSKPTEVSYMNGDKEVKLKFADALGKATINSDKAIETAYNDLKANLTNNFEGGKYNGEVVVKLIHNRRVSDSPYFYYVSFIESNDKYSSCLIDPTTGSIVNKKVK